MAKSPTAVVSESTKVTTDERKPSMHANYSIIWETKQVYTIITLKSKYVTIHGVNHWNSLKGNLRNSVFS